MILEGNHFLFLLAIFLGSHFYEGPQERMTLDRAAIFFPSPNAQDLDRGFVTMESGISVTINVSEKSGWTLTVSADRPMFVSSGSDKSCEDVLYKLHQEPEYSFRPFSTLDIPVLSGAGPVLIHIDFRLKIGWNDPPSSYTLNVVFDLRKERSVF